MNQFGRRRLSEVFCLAHISMRTKKLYLGMITAFSAAVLSLTAVAGNSVAPTSVSIPVSVSAVIKDDSGNASENYTSDEMYSIVIEPVSSSDEGESHMPANTKLQLKAGESGEFGPIEFAEPGSYIYRIYEEKGSTEKMTYDDTIYDVNVEIFSKEDSYDLYGVISTYKANSEEKAEVAFVNSIQKEKGETTTEKTDNKKGTTATGDTDNTLSIVMLISGSILFIFGICLLLSRKKKEIF